ncbi:hypothetical protein HZC07_00790, partial [Candidatus Micrarchaeota archaeon]|nr:hypothetical protein [Candidatus Micrarchaeota archaeon]
MDRTVRITALAEYKRRTGTYPPGTDLESPDVNAAERVAEDFAQATSHEQRMTLAYMETVSENTAPRSRERTVTERETENAEVAAKPTARRDTQITGEPTQVTNAPEESTEPGTEIEEGRQEKTQVGRKAATEEPAEEKKRETPGRTEDEKTGVEKT